NQAGHRGRPLRQALPTDATCAGLSHRTIPSNARSNPPPRRVQWEAVLSAKYALELRVIEVPGSFHTRAGPGAIPPRKRNLPSTTGSFVDLVTSGKDNMPSWYGILKNEKIEAIWAYIRATVDK